MASAPTVHEPAVPAAAGATRSGFLRKAGVGGVALVGGGALLGATAGVARAGHGTPAAPDTVPDLDVLNYALTLEYLEAAFYVQALGGAGTAAKFSKGAITGSKLFKGFDGRVRSTAYGYLSQIRNHEVAHVAFLRNALGKDAVPTCVFKFDAGLKNVDTFLKTARVLENTGVMAYDGAIRHLDTGDFLQAAATVATVEARHAAYLNLINRASPFPAAFDTPKKPSEILAAVQATGFLVSCPQPVLDLFARFKAADA